MLKEIKTQKRPVLITMCFIQKYFLETNQRWAHIETKQQFLFADKTIKNRAVKNEVYAASEKVAS